MTVVVPNDTVLVAMIDEAVSVPSKYPFPATESFANGEVVPMPTLPLFLTTSPVPVKPEIFAAKLVERESIP
ncbi:hypothetical protein GW935_04685, partial [Candidatus Falkowbacteria bacterium]|nr:hypothetical protein [Candidatus Falkowbacteria bacterium]